MFGPFVVPQVCQTKLETLTPQLTVMAIQQLSRAVHFPLRPEQEVATYRLLEQLLERFRR